MRKQAAVPKPARVPKPAKARPSGGGSKRKTILAGDTGGIHSNAFNFLSCVTTGVDPRTGMYSCSISLPGVAANGLCGPTVGLGLSFSALNPANAGFGRGWSLSTTRYDGRRQVLQLSTGESFKADRLVAGTMTFKDRKLRSFDMVQEAGGYRVTHKSGLSEFLKTDPGSDGVAVLREIRSPEGYVVTLQQQSTNGITRLMSMSDRSGVLLAVAYQTGRATVTLHPDTPQASVFTLHQTNDRLVTLALPEGTGEGWAFGYESTATGLLLLKTTTVPTGGREEALYKLAGHQLPGGAERPLTHMPVVDTFRRYPGHGQPTMVTRYTYSARNFFGYGALDDWMDDEDNLYRIVAVAGAPYLYSSTETAMDGIDAVKTIERTFNRFHLLTREVTTQDGCISETVTEYDENPSWPFDRQPPWCQLPVKTIETLSRVGSPDTRVMVESRTYDAHGNLLTHTDARGALETNTYYPMEGIVGFCPADPLGFVRCLQEKRVRPPEGTLGPVRLTRHRYELLPSLVDGAPKHLVSVYEAIQEEAADGAALLLSETITVFMADGGEHHGRLSRVISTVGGVENATEYAYEAPVIETNARNEALPTLVVAATRIGSNGHDSLRMTTRSARSLFSGQAVLEQGPGGVLMRYAHDALGRRVLETVAADSDFAATNTTDYSVSNGGSWVETTNVAGQHARTELDGFGREVRRVAIDWMGDGLEHEIWKMAFDTRGRKLSETTTDVGVPVARRVTRRKAKTLIATKAVTLPLTTRYRYDGWGNCIETVGPDGVIAHNREDPILRTVESWQEVIAAGLRQRSGSLRTTSSPSGKPLTVERLNAQGIVQNTRRYAYDGLDRCIVDTASAPGTVDKVTRYRYDVYDRLIETTLPDGAVVTRDYAAYRDEAIVEAIRIRHASLGGTDIILGRQAFDGLGRRTLFRAGRRDIRYAYVDNASGSPGQIHLPSGKTLTCRYEKHLGDRLVELSSTSDTATFVHDKIRGALTSANNALGTQTVSYLPSGRVDQETYRYAGDPGTSRQTQYGYTLLGLSTAYTGVDGEVRRASYDTLGRLATVQGDTLTVTVSYDAFSRTHRLVTQTRDGTRSMDTVLSYDEDGREIERVLTARVGATTQVQTLTQTYTPDDKLATRRLRMDEEARGETYIYDVCGRLTHYVCTGTHGPQDSSGHTIAEQVFTFDALNNIRTLVTAYAETNEPTKTSTFSYNTDDPTQLVDILHQQSARADEHQTLAYDESGNLTSDEAGRRLEYDAMGRLIGWTHAGERRGYRYDPLDRIGAVVDTAGTRYRYYQGGQVAHEAGEHESSSFHGIGGTVLAQTRLANAIGQTILLGNDAQSSVVSEAGDVLKTPAYGPHGHRADDAGDSDMAYAGELKDRDTRWYPLGSYRVYNPALMRFHSPDAASPFGKGGLNAYAYCAGDPVNHIDPSGEGLLDWILIGIGAIGTAIGVGLSFGTLAPAAAALWAGAAVTFSQAAAVVSTGVGIMSVATGAASVALNETGHASEGRVLGWMSMGYGVGSAVVGAAPAVAAGLNKVRSAYKAISELPVRLRNAGGAPRGLPNMRRIPGPVLDEMPDVVLDNVTGNLRAGADRINAAAVFPGARQSLLNRGLLSQSMFDEYPEGININNMTTRIQLRHASAGLHRTISPDDLARSGFDRETLLSLRPGDLHPTGPRQVIFNARGEYEGHMLGVRQGRFMDGELSYRRFLQTENINDYYEYLQQYVIARTAP